MHPYSRYYFELCCTPSTHWMATNFSAPRQLSDSCWTINHLQAGKMQQTTQAQQEGSKPAFLLLSDWDWCCVFFFYCSDYKRGQSEKKTLPLTIHQFFKLKCPFRTISERVDSSTQLVSLRPEMPSFLSNTGFAPWCICIQWWWHGDGNDDIWVMHLWGLCAHQVSHS